MTVDNTQKKIWAGLKRPSTDVSAILTDIQILEENGVFWSDFKSNAQTETSYTDFQTYLEGEGLTSEEASNIIKKLQDRYTDYADFSSDLDNYETYQQWKSNFSSTTQIGVTDEVNTTPGGIQVYPSGGTGRNGQSIPANGVEVYGTEVHFSQSGASGTTTGSASFSVTNLSIDDADGSIAVGTGVDISATIENTGSARGSKTLTLTEDGQAISVKTVTLSPADTTTVTFSVSKSNYVCNDYSINGTGPIEVCWVPAKFS